ncbi:MAG: VacB/RNase II family 3'-5' exoribonuclease [Chromatocurvus sp.]
MLNSDALSQLKGLKNQMESVKEHAEAIVKGAPGRYGFAVLDDGREVFIPPDEMLKTFPDDRVRVCIRPSDDRRSVAEVEKLIDSPLGEFAGQCMRKGKALFVRPDLNNIQRWLFLPPHARNGVREGDYVHCAVLRHPIRDGRPQAKVLKVIGTADTPGIENRYSMEKFDLQPEWPAAKLQQVDAALQRSATADNPQRLDLTDLDFISIDSAKTLDIDDALYADTSSDGWTLYIAIADPTAFVPGDSPLEADIARRATSVYFHGDVVPMLPESMSQDACALSAGNERPALVCKIDISDSGLIRHYDFLEAMVRSRAKLSYFAVDKYLSGEQDSLMSHASPLEALYQAFRALHAEREASGLLMEDRREFRWILNDQKQIESIERFEKMASQKLVEECMVAANRCAADFLARHEIRGPFVRHSGFRSDRREELQKFLQLHLPQATEIDITSVTGYRQLMRLLSDPAHTLPLRNMVNRLMTRAELSAEPGPHMGMALPCYTNCTSPLRKYVDFVVQRQIKAALHGREPIALDGAALAAIAARLQNARAASQAAERWLVANYLQRLQASTPGPWPAHISHIHSGGFTARLDDSGLEGQVDLRRDPEKFSYDKWHASLTSSSRRFQLNQPVSVELDSVDAAANHQCLMRLAPDCGLKKPG